MADTTYADVEDFVLRVGDEDVDPDVAQSMLNTAAEMVDAKTRGQIQSGHVVYQHKLGYEAFSVTTEPESRYYDDDPYGIVEIDDLQSVTSVVRNGTTLVRDTDYRLEPRNPGRGPYTWIRYITSKGVTNNRDSESYDTSYKGTVWPGTREVVVTGTWGYCSAEHRPAAVKELTLLVAQNLYEAQDLSADQVVGAVMNPAKYLDARAAPYIEVLRRVERERAI